MNGHGCEFGNDCRVFLLKMPDNIEHVTDCVRNQLDTAPEGWKAPAYRIIIDVYLYKGRYFLPGAQQGVDLDNVTTQAINAFSEKGWFRQNGTSDDKYVVEIITRKIRVEERNQEAIRVILYRCNPIDFPA